MFNLEKGSWFNLDCQNPFDIAYHTSQIILSGNYQYSTPY